MKIGFLGLGNMGTPMARNLLKAGHDVTGYNRTRRRAEELKAQGGKAAATPADAVSNVEVVITMLADDAALEEVMFGNNGALPAMKTGSIHVSMSTISVSLVERLTEEHGKHRQHFISAPVFGRPEAAEQAKLFIVSAGPAEPIKKCNPLFSALGQRTFDVGEKPSAANVAKLGGNFLIAVTIESFAEALTLGRKHGLDPQIYFEFLTETLFGSPVAKTYGSRIARDNFEPVGFRLPLGLKDVRLALAAAESAAVPMPFATVIRDQMLEALARGMENADWSAFARVVAENAGL